jgi:DNA helicase-4
VGQSAPGAGLRHRGRGGRQERGGAVIADFLFYNGVAYTYEKPYSVDVADAEHSQYRPDFHYNTPHGDLWHEHWGLDAQGRPRADFEGYLESMQWKKDLHAQHGTALIETTWAQIFSPTGLHELAATLRSHGLNLDWNPDRHSHTPPMKHEDLAKLIRQFMTHAKSNSLTPEQMQQRVTERIAPGGRHRTRLFLQLYGQIVQAWDARLEREGAVDFEDMLVQAAQHVEAGTLIPDFDLVLVDEFQDTSRARARLVQALLAPPGRHLLTVGDDWQSINRFTGSDISVMADFAREFGDGPTLRLQTTFRCPQELCDTASAFVSKNPRQLPKTVRSIQPQHGARVRLIVAAHRDQLSTELSAELTYLAQLHADQTAAEPATTRSAAPSAMSSAMSLAMSMAATPATVDVLFRYNFERDLLPVATPPGLRVKGRTVHRSKGLEADYIIIPNLTRGAYGFPSTIEDDPVLDVAMTESDSYPYAEERRLFYVALTRARKQVTLLTVQGRESPFVMELISDGRVDVVCSPGPPPQPCPKCGRGSLVRRKGPRGEFLGCSTYPQCRHTA